MKKYNKNLVLIISMVMLVTFAFTGCGGQAADSANEDQEVYELKISHITTETDPLHLGYSFLAETLNEKTNGRIKVTIYGNKQLANSDREQAEMVQNNLIQMTSTPSFTLAALNETLNEFFIYDFPYLFEDNQAIYNFADGEIGQEILQELNEKTGIRGYGPFPLGWVKVSSNKQPILAPTDIEGLKIRTTSSDMYINLMASFGAGPTPISYGELYTALQQKTVDGMMTTTGLYVSDRFYEVQKYMGCIDPFTILHYPIVNGQWYDTLPDDLKVAFDESMLEYVVYMRDLEESEEEKAKATLRDKGMEVTEYTAEQKQAFIDLALPLIDQNGDLVGTDFLERTKEFLGK